MSPLDETPPAQTAHASYGYGYPPYAGERPLGEYLHAFRRFAWLILLAASVGLGLAAYRVHQGRPVYRATAVIRLVEQGRLLTRGIAEGAPDPITADPILSQLQMLRTRSLAARIVREEPLGLRVEVRDFPPEALSRVHLEQTVSVDSVSFDFEEARVVARGGSAMARAPYGEPLELGGLTVVVGQRPDVRSGAISVRSEAAAVDRLLGGLSARVRDRTDVVDLEFTAHDPHVAQRVVNAVARVFEAQSVESARRESMRRRVFIEEQLHHTDSLLTASLDALSAFRSREQLYTSREKFSAQQAGLMELQLRREETEADRRLYASLLEELVRRQGQGETTRAFASSPGISGHPVVQQLYGQLVEFEIARSSLTAGAWGSAESHPEVVRLNSLIAATEARLIEAVRSHVAALEARVAVMDELRARTAADLRGVPEAETEEVILVQRTETLRRMADQLQEEYQRSRISESVEGGRVEVVDLAPLPGPAGGGSRIRTLLLGLVLGLMAGSGGALVLERMNTSIRRWEELETVLRLPGLALLPKLTVKKGGRGLLRRAGRDPAPPQKGGGGAGLITRSDIHSPDAEAYRTLRTNLIFSQPGSELKTLVVASASPGEGKTTTAANLAVTFAHHGVRVLLIDADLRMGRLHKMFGVTRIPGVPEMLLSEKGPRDAIRTTSIRGLWLLPAGLPFPYPGELLGGERMREALTVFAGRFDMVVIDTPPLLAAADAAVLGSQADGVILVVRAGSTEREEAVQALQQLARVGANVLGAVLNDPESKVPRYSRYRARGYYGVKTSRTELDPDSLKKLRFRDSAEGE